MRLGENRVLKSTYWDQFRVPHRVMTIQSLNILRDKLSVEWTQFMSAQMEKDKSYFELTEMKFQELSAAERLRRGNDPPVFMKGGQS